MPIREFKLKQASVKMKIVLCVGMQRGGRCVTVAH